MKEMDNPYSRWMELQELSRVVGTKVDNIDNLKVKEYGGTHYVYTKEGDEL